MLFVQIDANPMVSSWFDIKGATYQCRRTDRMETNSKQIPEIVPKLISTVIGQMKKRMALVGFVAVLKSGVGVFIRIPKLVELRKCW